MFITQIRLPQCGNVMLGVGLATSSLSPLSTSEDLNIHEDRPSESKLDWPDDIENTLWSELLHPSTSVKKL